MAFGIIAYLVLTTISTGNAYSESTVINEIEGDGKVYTRIEVEANGERKILEATGAGRYELEVKKDSGSAGAVVQSEVSTAPESSETKSIPEGNSSLGTKIKNFVDDILKMVSKIFRLGA